MIQCLVNSGEVENKSEKINEKRNLLELNHVL